MSEAGAISPEQNFSKRRLGIFKDVHSKELGGLCMTLAEWAQKKYGKSAEFRVPGHLLPQAEERGINGVGALRLDIVRVKEMKFRPELLLALNSIGKTVNDNLIKEVPQLTRPQDFEATRARVHFNDRTEETFVALEFMDNDAQKLYEQREDVLYTLERTSGMTDLDWTFRTPSIRIGYFEPDTITGHERKFLKQFVSAHLPIGISTGGVRLPKFGHMDLSNLQPAEAAA